MRVECTRRPKALLPPDVLPPPQVVDEVSGIMLVKDERGVLHKEWTTLPVPAIAGWNLAPYVHLEYQSIPGHDDTPIIVPAGCGHTFDVPDPGWLWDLNTALVDGREMVVERHYAPLCPACGRIADHLSVPLVEPEELLVGHDLLDVRLRFLFDGELADLTNRQRAIIENALRNGGTVIMTPDGDLVPRISGGTEAGYSHNTEGAVALSAATAKTVIAAKAGSAVGLNMRSYKVAFDGVTASAVPVLVEEAYCTFATNSPGTNSTNTTERQKYGRVITADWTGGRNWTTEPTTITVSEEFLLTPNGGTLVYDFPLGTEPDSAVSEGFALRMNAPAAVNVRSSQTFVHN